MNRLCANLSMLFTEVPLAQRFALASACGFSSVEMQYPYEIPAHELRCKLDDLGLKAVLINAPLGSEPGRRGLAAVTGQRGAFQTALLHGLDYANTLGCDLLHVLSGTVDATEREVAEATWLGNMAWAAEEADDAGLTLVVEALNAVDVPGYFLRSIDHASALIGQVGHPRLKLLFDTWHCAMSGLDCVTALRGCIDHVGHVQIADFPGRAEPGTGTIDWKRLFGKLREMEYAGALGLEFRNRQDVPHCFDVVRGFIDSYRADAGIDV